MGRGGGRRHRRVPLTRLLAGAYGSGRGQGAVRVGAMSGTPRGQVSCWYQGLMFSTVSGGRTAFSTVRRLLTRSRKVASSYGKRTPRPRGVESMMPTSPTPWSRSFVTRVSRVVWGRVVSGTARPSGATSCRQRGSPCGLAGPTDGRSRRRWPLR